jgi:DNA-binding PadR family transcriptional regulator
VLEKAGLVEIEKGYEGRRGRTWIHLTAAGKKALHDEISQLKRLIRQVEELPGADPAPEPS